LIGTGSQDPDLEGVTAILSLDTFAFGELLGVSLGASLGAQFATSFGGTTQKWLCFGW